MDPVLIYVFALTVYSDSVSLALTVPDSIVFSLLTGCRMDTNYLCCTSSHFHLSCWFCRLL